MGQQILHVEEADNTPVVGDQHPRVTRAGQEVLGLGDRSGRGDRDEIVRGRHHVCHRESAERQCPREATRLGCIQLASGGRLVEHRAEFLGRVRLGEFVGGLYAQHPRSQHSESVERPDHRSQQQCERPVDRGQGHQRCLGTRQGNRLGDHLAGHHVNEGQQGQGDREADHRRGPFGQGALVQQPLDGPSQHWLHDPTQHQRHRGDAQLARCQLHVEGSHAGEGRHGAHPAILHPLFDPAATRCEQ